MTEHLPQFLWNVAILLQSLYLTAGVDYFQRLAPAFKTSGHVNDNLIIAILSTQIARFTTENDRNGEAHPSSRIANCLNGGKI
jgi:hypothetical protein